MRGLTPPTLAGILVWGDTVAYSAWSYRPIRLNDVLVFLGGREPQACMICHTGGWFWGVGAIWW